MLAFCTYRRYALVLLALGLCWRAAAADEVRWLTGEPLRKALTQKAGLTWSNVSLRQSLTRFCKAQKLAFVLDRRIDPDQKIDLAFEDVPLEEALKRIAAKLDVGVTMVGPVAYFGPKQAAENVRTVVAMRIQDATSLPPAARKHWIQLRPLKWPEATSPSELLVALGRENGLEIRGLEQIPFDLWAEGDLPTLNLAERLSLLLIQFDLTFEISADGKSITLVPFPADPKIERTYNVAGAAQETARRLRENAMLAGAEITTTGNRLLVRARQEDHDAIRELLAGRPVTRSNVRQTTRQVYTLRVNLAAGKLLDQLAKRLEIEVKIDRDAIAAKGISLDQEVQVDVKQVTADQLLRAVLDPVGLTFKRGGNVVEVVPK